MSTLVRFGPPDVGSWCICYQVVLAKGKTGRRRKKKKRNKVNPHVRGESTQKGTSTVALAVHSPIPSWQKKKERKKTTSLAQREFK